MSWRLFRWLLVVLILASAGRSAVQQTSSSGQVLPVQSTKPKDLAAGKLLVASRNIGDPNFMKTVVLLVRYDGDGVVGLILNRRTRVPMSKVLALDVAKDRTDPIYLGGPVEPAAVFALLRSTAKIEGAEPVLEDVYQVHTKAMLEKAVSTRPDSKGLRVYVGYAGWSNTQLRMELEFGSWFIFPGDAKTIFDPDPDSLWSRMIGKTELELAANGPANAATGLPTSLKARPR